MNDATLVAVGGLASALMSAIVCYLTVPRMVAKVLPTVLESLEQGERRDRD